MRDAMRAKIKLLSAELEGAGPVSVARRLCIEAVVFAWLEHWCVAACTGGGNNASPAQQRRQNGAARRFLSSVKVLAQITALERPRPAPVKAVQVNVRTAAPSE
jgi:hypothetical protein